MPAEAAKRGGARPLPPAAKGEVTAAMSEQVLTLDPANHYSISSTSILRHVFDPLIDATADSKFVPALAEKWENVDDLTWKFTLRKDVKFHDGTPFNADSVIYTITRVRDDTKLIKSFVYQDIASVEKDGDNGSSSRRRRRSARCWPPDDARHDAAEREGEGRRVLQQADRDRPVQVRELDPWRDEWSWRRTRSYWVSGKPKVAKATIRTIPEVSTRSAGLRAGEIDIIDRIPADLVKTLEGSPGVKVMNIPAVETQQWASRTPRRRPTTRCSARRSAWASTATTIIKEFHLGYAKEATCPTPPGLVGYTDLGRSRTTRPGEGSAQGVRGLQPDDRLRADEGRLHEADRDRPGGRRDAGRSRHQGEHPRDGGRRGARRPHGRDYHLFYSGWAHMPHDPDWYYGQWFTKAGAEKLTRYNNPKVEQLIMEAAQADPKLRQAKYEELQKIIWAEEEATIWPYLQRRGLRPRDRIGGYEAGPDYYVLLRDVSVG